MICYSLTQGKADTSDDDRLVFWVCLPIYAALTAAIAGAAVRAARGKSGRYERVLLFTLFPFIIGLLISPAYLATVT